MQSAEVAAYTEAVRSNRRLVLRVIGGLIAIATLWFTRRRDRLHREKQILDQDANVTNRYPEAISQLGPEQVALRLGEAYALERIAAAVTAMTEPFIRSTWRSSAGENPQPRTARKTCRRR